MVSGTKQVTSMYEVAFFLTKGIAETGEGNEFTISFPEEFRFNIRMLPSKLDQDCQAIISDLQHPIQNLWDDT